MDGLLHPSRNLLIGLIVLFVVLAVINAAADLGFLNVLIYLLLVALLVYFIVLAVREFRRASNGPER